MTSSTLQPGRWPTDDETLTWMDRMARHYLGTDYGYLAPDVVSKVCEDWRFRESESNDRARIETRLRSKASDLRKAEQRRRAREDGYEEPAARRAELEGWLIELDDVLDRASADDETREIVGLVVDGYSIAEIERKTGHNRYKISSMLSPLGPLLWPERSGDDR